jgi:zinc-finger of a C2HC-type
MRLSAVVSGGALLQAQNAAAAAAFEEGVMEACGNCGRTFLADRLKIHQRRQATSH